VVDAENYLMNFETNLNKNLLLISISNTHCLRD